MWRSGDDDEGRPEVLWPEGGPGIKVSQCLLGTLVAVGVAAYVGGPIAAAAGLAIAALGSLWTLARVPKWVLGTSTLTCTRGGRPSVILPLDRRLRLESEWIPYRGGVLSIRGSGARLELNVSESNREFRAALGAALGRLMPERRFSDAVERELGR